MLNAKTLSDIELLTALSKLTQDNKLLTWFDQCYGSPEDVKRRGPGGPTWQKDFYDAGSFAKERLVMAANGVGKSETVCAELAMHVTGIYPSWWEGYRSKALDAGGWEAWVGSIDNDMQRRGPQRALFGRELIQELWGTGFIPKDRLPGRKQINMRHSGIKDVIDTVAIKHSSGRPVTLKFLTFEQGWRKWQSGDPKIILWDEEPDDSVIDQKDILSEVLTRLVRNSGIFLCGYTPLLGETQLTDHFMHSESAEVYYIGASWDDAPHLDESAKARIMSEYPEHQRDARTKGIPMMGEGRIFTAGESQILCDPFRIPDHWSRIIGLDFGGIQAHPHAMAEIAFDRDTGTIYVVHTWKDNGKLRDHADVINARGTWIPVSWPHDGHKHDPKSGKEMKKIYQDYGVNMLSRSARYENKVGGPQSQWRIIEEIKELIDQGKFKVFRSCQGFLSEYNSYHTKNGQIVAKRDDILKAIFYAVMMRRYAMVQPRVMRSVDESAMAFTTAVR